MALVSWLGWASVLRVQMLLSQGLAAEMKAAQLRAGAEENAEDAACLEGGLLVRTFVSA